MALALPALLVFASGAAAEEWRFCVGVASASHEAVITDIFPNSADSAHLEHRIEAWYRGKSGRALTFQCPRGWAERVDALNAQTAALQFNRQMGYAVSNLNAAEVTAIIGAQL
ncbi:hypothetical protein [Rhodoblastus sp.]|uniref:hypothetical protein n=1 Tax=Rhodoblastus sp. TaxID=1962975 RepID=UPI00261AD654|nr:hypothetical protein [Rhodoblastus sp.]